MRKVLSLSICFLFAAAMAGCSFGFSDRGSVDPGIKTVRVNFIENRAPYVNPQLSPNITDRLKQKIVSQTKLSQLNSDKVDWDIYPTITDYSVSTSGITSANGRSETSINRLTVNVHVRLVDQLNNTTKEYDVSRQFDFGARQSLQSAEAGLLDEMVRNLTDEIFNKLFSAW